MSKNDAVIKELMAKLEEQKAGLGKTPRGTWLTNGIFKFNSSDYFNINVVTDFSKLAGALGFLLLQEDAFNKGCDALGVKAEFKWDGYTRDDWEEDFKTRIAIVEYDSKKRTLDATKKKLQSLVSEETRTEMELDEIKKLLG